MQLVSRLHHADLATGAMAATGGAAGEGKENIDCETGACFEDLDENKIKHGEGSKYPLEYLKDFF